MGPRRIISGLVIVLLLVLGVTVAGPGMLADRLRELNPFSESTVDRTGPSVLQALNDISEFHPASAHYETVVDLEKETDNLPRWISGERVLYVGKGDVDVVIDFGALQEGAVVLSEDGTSVTVDLPAPRIDTPVLDLENSYVADHGKGLATRFRGSDLERQAQLEAVRRMTTAAEGESMLIDRAEENTTAMLRGLLGSLGYTSVTVRYGEPAS